MKKLIILFLLVSGIFSNTSYAQKNKSEESTSDFNKEEFYTHLLHQINLFRASKGVDSLELNDILKKAADISTTNMSKENRADLKNGGKTTAQRLTKAGGTNKAEECVVKSAFVKGKNTVKPFDMAKAIVDKWKTDKKNYPQLLNPSNVYVGLSSSLDKSEKNVFVSVVLGNFQSFNTGAKKKKELKVPFNTKSKKLLPKDEKKCRNCEKFRDLELLREGLYVEKGKVYLKYDNLKNLKRLLKKATDGLAVDIVQKDQYSKADYNIMDNNLKNKGVMSKVLYKDKLFAKNLIKPDPKAKGAKKKINKLLVELGKFPAGITGPYELNLIVIQDKIVCKTIMRGFIEKGDQESNTPLEMMPMPESVAARMPPFEPRSESSILNFTIPFEKNKSEFKPEDVKPFLDALQEPDFIIEGLYIYAYSSIEGDSVANAKLQRKRAESVVKVLQSFQNNKINPSIVTNDSWALFQLEMEDGKYDYLTKMSKKEAIRTINSKGLSAELEQYLSKQRFAQIVMDVTYDISGTKEQKFTQIQFNRMLKQGNMKQAYKIMDYIGHRTHNKYYTDEIWDNLVIPDDPKNVGMLMNKVYYDYINHSSSVLEEHLEEIHRIQKIDPANNVINYNELFCKIQLDSTVGDSKAQSEVQKKIDAFYKTDIPKKNVDGLNIEWQFKLLEAIDTVENSEAQVEAIVNRIKGFYNFNDASWQNALKAAYGFARAKDYKFASGLLENFVKKDDADPKLIFAYISMAAHVPEKFFSSTFVLALNKAKELDKDRYCKLFGDPHMTFQVLDNPKIKADFREAGCSN